MCWEAKPGPPPFFWSLNVFGEGRVGPVNPSPTEREPLRREVLGRGIRGGVYSRVEPKGAGPTHGRGLGRGRSLEQRRGEVGGSRGLALRLHTEAPTLLTLKGWPVQPAPATCGTPGRAQQAEQRRAQ